jgi:chorismate mutase
MDTQPTEPEQKKSDVEQTLDKIDSAVKLAEECLKECDDQINEMIERRGRIATQVQHIWNLRHGIKKLIEDGKRPPDWLARQMRGF